jgi:hypothetical protein
VIALHFIGQARPRTPCAKGDLMKVIGLGLPDDVRVRFDACEVEVLVDVLRDLRAKATRDAADLRAHRAPARARRAARCARLPLVTHGAHAVRHLRQSTGLDAYLVVPSYGDVIVLARAGDHAPALWSLVRHY